MDAQRRAREATRSALRRVEQSDFFYRDSYRTYALITIGRISLQRDAAESAATAFKRAVAEMHTRPRTFVGGHLMAQALAALAAPASEVDVLTRARTLCAQRAAPSRID